MFENNLRTCVNKLTPEQRIKLTIFSAKDILHLRNNTTQDLISANIAAAEQWLIDHEDFTDSQIKMAVHLIAFPFSNLIFVATKASDTSKPIFTYYGLTNAAAYCPFLGNDPDAYHKERNNKLHLYLVYANSLLLPSYANSIDTTIPVHQIIKDLIDDSLTVHERKGLFRILVKDILPECGIEILINRGDKVCLTVEPSSALYDIVSGNNDTEVIDELFNNASLLRLLQDFLQRQLG